MSRRSDQRRAAVFAIYQAELTERELEDVCDRNATLFTRALAHAAQDREDELDAHVATLAARLASGPPVALAQTKALLNDGVQSSMREALAAEARAQTVNFATDAPEGFRAFAEKRDPDYTGAWRVT